MIVQGKVCQIKIKLIVSKKKFSRLEEELIRKRAELLLLESEKTSLIVNHRITITSSSHSNDKIKLFRTLFKGRQDVFAKRYENSRTGKAGITPACANDIIIQI